MKTIRLIALPLFFSAAAAMAQNDPVTGISESTDPSKAAEVQRRAEQMRSAQNSSGATAMGGQESSSMADSGHKPRHGAHHAKHPGKHHGPKGAAAPDSAAPQK